MAFYGRKDMAKDDYFVIAAKILTYLYSCMKKGVIPDREIISADELGINEAYWLRVMANLSDSGYISGITYAKHVGFPTGLRIDPEEFMITVAGIEYLHENGAMRKALQAISKYSGIAAGIVQFLGL